jgi:lysophospholipase L1-like esterase
LSATSVYQKSSVSQSIPPVQHPAHARYAKLRFCAALLAIAALAGPVAADGEWSDQGRCNVPESFIAQQVPLSRTALKLNAGLPIKIVAIGSSSTAGSGASDPDNAYPARLQDELQRLWPTADITVVNRGVGGERVNQMLARFDKDVFAEKPDLVIWQAGTNGALRGDGVDTLRNAILEGIARLRQERIDVILMSPQYAPSFNRAQRNLLHVEAIRSAGRQAGVAVFRRFEIMQYWLASSQMTLDEMLSPDGLHLNDLSYGCVANQMAALIDHAVNGSSPMMLAANRLPASVFAGEGSGQ